MARWMLPRLSERVLILWNRTMPGVPGYIVALWGARRS
jgi:hypothetical protein